MACHAAVKANYPLTHEKMRYILAELRRTAYSSVCPHGRPVVLRITTVDGDTATVEAPANRWFEGRSEITVEGTVDGEVARVELDPDGLYADVDPSDDVWTP